MWKVDALELRPAAYDFSDAGVGEFRGHALVADETVLLNMVETVECDLDGCFQATICTTCGTVHCEPGGWIGTRRAGGAIVWLPCFERALNDHDRAEYRPPSFVAERGVPLFAGALADKLLKLVPRLAASVRPLTTGDAIRAMQLEAPARVLGTPGEPIAIRRDLVIAANEGEVRSHLDALDALLKTAEATTALALVEIVDARPLDLYLDVRATPAWRPLALDARGRPVLLLEPLGAFLVAEAQ